MTNNSNSIKCFTFTFHSFPDPSTSLLCPEGVSTFSAGPHQQHYYACAKPHSKPLLKYCPPSHTYSARKQRCVRGMGTSQGGRRMRRDVDGNERVSDLQTVVEPVLGSSVYLGRLEVLCLPHLLYVNLLRL